MYLLVLSHHYTNLKLIQKVCRNLHNSTKENFIGVRTKQVIDMGRLAKTC